VSPIFQLVLLALLLVGGVALLAATLMYVVHQQNSRRAGPFHRCNTESDDRTTRDTEPATVSRDIRSKNMLSVSERTNLVDTIDTLSRLEDGGESIVSLLGRLRAAHPSACWRILYVEQVGGAENTRLAQVQAMVELTTGNLSRKNIGEAADGGNGDPFLAAVVNALIPMLLVELADIRRPII
jgi:hypothetical protein